MRNRSRELGYRGHNFDVRQVLERAHLVLVERSLSTNEQHRALSPKGVRYTGNGASRARPSGYYRAARYSGAPGVTCGSGGGALLVMGGNNCYGFAETAGVDVDDVSAAQSENYVDTFGLESLGHEMAA